MVSLQTSYRGYIFFLEMPYPAGYEKASQAIRADAYKKKKIVFKLEFSSPIQMAAVCMDAATGWPDIEDAIRASW